MTEKYNCDPDDDIITEMDPVKKQWLFYSWNQHMNDQLELAKNSAYLIGSFINPKAVQNLLQSEQNSFNSSEESFEKTSEILKNNPDFFDSIINGIENNNQEIETKPSRRRRPKV